MTASALAGRPGPYCHHCMTESHDDATTTRGKGSRTRPMALAAPRQVPLTAEQELAAIDALTQLLADWPRERAK
jgi:hypothetical protein